MPPKLPAVMVVVIVSKDETLSPRLKELVATPERGAPPVYEPPARLQSPTVDSPKRPVAVEKS